MEESQEYIELKYKYEKLLTKYRDLLISENDCRISYENANARADYWMAEAMNNHKKRRYSKTRS